MQRVCRTGWLLLACIVGRPRTPIRCLAPAFGGVRAGGKKSAATKAEDAELDALMEELNQPAKPAAAAEAAGKKKKKGKGAKGLRTGLLQCAWA